MPASGALQRALPITICFSSFPFSIWLNSKQRSDLKFLGHQTLSLGWCLPSGAPLTLNNEPEDVSVSTELNRKIVCDVLGVIFSRMLLTGPFVDCQKHQKAWITIMILSLLALAFSPKEYMHYILPAAAVFAPALTLSDHLPTFVCLCMFLTVPHQRAVCVCKCLTQEWDRGSLILYRCISHVSLQGQHHHPWQHPQFSR